MVPGLIEGKGKPGSLDFPSPQSLYLGKCVKSTWAKNITRVKDISSLLGGREEGVLVGRGLPVSASVIFVQSTCMTGVIDWCPALIGSTLEISDS